MIRKIWILLLLLLVPLFAFSQCNQHVFTSVGAEKWTNFQYQDCDGAAHYFGLPAGGYTIIYCADIGTAFVWNMRLSKRLKDFKIKCELIFVSIWGRFWWLFVYVVYLTH